MATNKEPIFLNAPLHGFAVIDNAQGTTAEDLFTVGADGGAITNIVATSTDSSAVTIVLSISVGTNTNVIGEVTIPAGSGTNGTANPVNVLTNVGLTGINQNDGSMVLGDGGRLVVNAKAAVTAATQINITATGANYTAST